MILATVLNTVAELATILPADIPNPAPVQPPGTEGFITIMGWVKWIGFGLAGIAVILVGIQMFFNSRRGEGGEHAGKLGWVLGGIILIGAAAGIVSSLMGA